MASGTEIAIHSELASCVPGALADFARIEELALIDPGQAFLSAQQRLAERTVELLQEPGRSRTSYSDLVWLDAGAVDCFPPRAGAALHLTDNLSAAHPERRSMAGFVRHHQGIAGIILPPNPNRKFSGSSVTVGGLPGVEFRRLEFDVYPEEYSSRLCLGKEVEQAFLRIAAERWLLLSAVVLGTARASFNYVLDYARKRVAFGKPLCQHQAVALRLADLAIGLESARLLCRDAWTGCDDLRSNFETAREVWRYVRETAMFTGPEALQVMGGHGYLRIHPVEQWYRDMQFLCLYGEIPEAFVEET